MQALYKKLSRKDQQKLKRKQKSKGKKAVIRYRSSNGEMKVSGAEYLDVILCSIH